MITNDHLAPPNGKKGGQNRTLLGTANQGLRSGCEGCPRRVFFLAGEWSAAPGRGMMAGRGSSLRSPAESVVMTSQISCPRPERWAAHLDNQLSADERGQMLA